LIGSGGGAVSDLPASGNAQLRPFTGRDQIGPGDDSWLDSQLLDRRNQIAHVGGIADVPGLYVIGRPVTRRRSSGFIAGIASDAVELTDHLRRQLDRSTSAA
jgi:hypothetical protein